MPTRRWKLGATLLLAAAVTLIGFFVLPAAAEPVPIQPSDLFKPVDIKLIDTPAPIDFQPLSRPATMPTVLAGEGHTVALRSDGTVWSWGDNGYGQLGRGTVDKGSPIPTQVGNLSDIVAIAAEGGASFLKTGHTVALKSDGTVWTWGNNENGQLGLGTTDKGSSVPVQVPGLSDVVAIAAGSLHTLALKSNGTVWAWGYNYYGQLGNGTKGSSSVPVQVTGLNAVTSISAQYLQSVAVRSDGTVWTWGSNFFGYLGYDTKGGSNPTPKQVPKLKGIVSVKQGHLFTVALAGNGTVWTWGSNLFGSLGIGSSGQEADFFEPQQVLYNKNPDRPLNSVVSISAGQGFALALLKDGSVWGWGANDSGQLGKGDLTNRSLAVKVNLDGTFTGIGTGKFHSMAIKNDGTIWTWGFNGSYRLGYATPPPEPPEGASSVPRQVADFNLSNSLASLVLDREEYAITVGGSHPIQATAVYSDGSRVNVTDQAKVQSSDPAVVAVNSAGVLSGLRAGQATLAVTFLDRTVNAKVVVTDAPGNTPAPGNSPDPIVTLTDIDGHWAESTIVQAVNQGIATGYPDFTFKPDRSVSRAEFAVLLMNALKPSGEGAEIAFTDKESIGTWAIRQIAQSVELGIIKGYANGTFRPNKTITRAEMITMVVRASRLPIRDEAATGYADDADIPKYARGPVVTAQRYGIAAYIVNDKFEPNKPATRAESVSAIVNMLKAIKGEKG